MFFLFTGPGRARVRAAVMLVTSSLAATGCGGGGSIAPTAAASNVPPGSGPASGARTADVRLTFTFPDRSTASAARRRQYVSPSIASLSIVLDNGAPIYVNAPIPGASRTVTVTIPAPVGTNTFAFAEYDMSNGTGNLLGRTTQNANVVGGIVNNLSFTLDGNLAKIAIAPVGSPQSPFLEGTAAAGYTLVGNLAVPFVATPQDADGNTIIAPGNVPTIAVAGPASSPVVVVPGANNAFGLYAAAPTTPVKITASGTNLDGTAVTASIMVGASAAIYIANYVSQTITAYDEAGTQLPLPATSFGGLTNPMGIAYIPAATPGTSGSLVITETANSSAPYVTQYDQSGVVAVLQNTAYTGTAQPLFPAYAPGASPLVSLPNYQNSTITQYDTNGNPKAPVAGKFTGLSSPVQIAYDSNNANYYVTNLGTFTIARFMADGTPVGTGVAAGSHTMGVAYDSNNKHLYVAYAGQVATASSSTASPSGIAEFDESLASISTSGQFANANPTTAAYIGILFDPFDKQLYVTDAGNNAVVAFTEAGAAVTLPTGAFAKLNDPMSLAIVP